MLDGMRLNQKVNNGYLTNANPSTKAIIAYYSSISYAYELTKKLGLGPMCSNELINYVSKYFNNNQIIKDQLAECKVRGIGDEYSLNRLELSEFNGRITASFAMTYFKNGKSQDDVIGVDEFKINADKSVSIINLSSKESAQKVSEKNDSQLYDIQKTAPEIYEAYKIKLRSELLRVICAGNKYIPSFQDFYNDIDKSNFNPTWSISRVYNINWSVYYDDAGYRKIDRHDTITNDKDVNYWSLLWACKIDMPVITVKGANAKFTTLAINNITVDFTKGISLAKIKDDKIEFNDKYKPSTQAIDKIKSKISGMHYKGDYLITFEFGNVLNEGYENINFEKLKNNIYKTPAGWIIKL